jgi:two-component system, cell cycle sensor histidine kinase and response regulator CckA
MEAAPDTNSTRTAFGGFFGTVTTAVEKATVWKLVWIGTGSAMAITEVVVGAMSWYVFGQPQLHDLVFGAVAALLASLFVLPLLAHLVIQLRESREQLVRNDVIRASEAKYRELHESMRDGFAATDLSGHLIEFNEAFRAMLGYSAEKLRTMSYVDLTPERWHAVEDAILREQVFRRGYSDLYEKEYLRADGSLVPVELKVVLIQGPDGNPTGARAIVRDITGRKRTEQALLESEARYADLYENAPDMFASVDAQTGRLVQCNNTLANQLGYKKEDILNRLFFDLYAPSCLELAQSSFASFLRTGEVHDVPLVLRRKDGNRIDISLQASAIRDGQGRILRTRSVMRDITERRKLEQSLHERERQLSSIYGNASDILFLLSVEPGGRFRYVSVNPSFLRSSGYSEEQVLGRLVEEVMPEPALTNALRHCDRAIRTRQTARWDCVCDFPAGRKYGEISVTPIFDSTGNATSLVGTIHDVTERREAEAELARLEEQVRRAEMMESVGRLAGGVAHDFNNLLTIINGYAVLLSASLPPGDPLREYADEVAQAGGKAARLTDHLLAYGRRQLIRPVALNLNEAIEAARQVLHRILGEQFDLETRLQPDLGHVLADPSQIDQVVVNLVSNAREAMPAGGSITISTANVEVDSDYAAAHPDAQSGPCVRLQISDHGVGMDQATLHAAFEPFFTTKPAGSGSGLGLAMVYGVVRQNGGWIDVTSTPGEGSTFSIYLPRIQVPSAGQSAAPASPRPVKGTETVLLVEDQEAVRRLARVVLTARGYRVIEAHDSTSAIRAAASHEDIQLLVTDVILPGMNGRDLASLLRADRRDLRVLFISGYPADVIADCGVLADDVPYLPKPFSPEVFAAKVREVLASHSE